MLGSSLIESLVVSRLVLLAAVPWLKILGRHRFIKPRSPEVRLWGYLRVSVVEDSSSEAIERF